MPKSKFLGLLAVACLAGGFPAWAGKPVTKQVEITTTEAEVSVASGQRQAVTIKAHVANDGLVYCGPATVTASNGFELAAGDGLTLQLSDGSLDGTVILECIAGSGTQNVSVLEHNR